MRFLPEILVYLHIKYTYFSTAVQARLIVDTGRTFV